MTYQNIPLSSENAEKFFKKANTKFNNWFNYSKATYVNNYTFIDIICPTHGLFRQTPSNHLSRKFGCPKCAKLASKRNQPRRLISELLEDFKKIHGNFYGYEKVVFFSYKENIEIVCPIHGSFWQKPSNHLQGNNCPICAAQARCHSTEIFVKNAISVHGLTYDYSLVQYKHNAIKVKILCKIHGAFNQRPNDHLNGHGCPKCTGRISKEETAWIKSFNNPNIIQQYKINLPDNSYVFVDGYDSLTNTIYEYHGKYWHGHPDQFPNRAAIHPKSKRNVSELYEHTLSREQLLKDLNYSIISVWH